MFKTGDKVQHLGLCYVIASIEGDVAHIRIARVVKRNPRGRKLYASVPVSSLTPWQPSK